jgi:hypothetical protein
MPSAALQIRAQDLYANAGPENIFAPIISASQIHKNAARTAAPTALTAERAGYPVTHHFLLALLQSFLLVVRKTSLVAIAETNVIPIT